MSLVGGVGHEYVVVVTSRETSLASHEPVFSFTRSRQPSFYTGTLVSSPYPLLGSRPSKPTVGPLVV